MGAYQGSTASPKILPGSLSIFNETLQRMGLAFESSDGAIRASWVIATRACV